MNFIKYFSPFIPKNQLKKVYFPLKPKLSSHIIRNDNSVKRTFILNNSLMRNKNINLNFSVYFSSIRLIHSENLKTDLDSEQLSEFLTPPPTPIDNLITESLPSDLSEPTLSSLGLGGWTPKGLVQHGLELLHVNLDLPWWGAIVIGTIIIRTLIFPLVILSQRNAANLNNNLPTIQRMQQRMTLARMSGEMGEAVKSSKEMMDFMKKNKINPLKNLLVPLAQVPIFLSVFTGLREMANLPVTSLQQGGTLWFSDLTLTDPYFLLPVFTVLTLAATIEVGVDGIKANQVGSNKMKFILRTMPFLAFPFMISFPSAMLCYWFTSNFFSLIQVLTLKIPKIKEFFSIPPIIDHSTSFPVKQIQIPNRGFVDGFKQSIKNIQLANEIEEREKIEKIEFEKKKKKIKEK